MEKAKLFMLTRKGEEACKLASCSEQEYGRLKHGKCEVDECCPQKRTKSWDNLVPYFVQAFTYIFRCKDKERFTLDMLQSKAIFYVHQDVEENLMSKKKVGERKYDVFVSFHGEDIRRVFLSHLVEGFKSKNIKVFVDDEIERGEEIWPSLVEAIEGSSISLIIFSQGYASSHWCLDEVVKIIECREKDGQIVIPVFYCIEPKDVRDQLGSYKNAFDEHEIKYERKVPIWRHAMNKSTLLAGIQSSKFRDDAELLKNIVDVVLTSQPGGVLYKGYLMKCGVEIKNVGICVVRLRGKLNGVFLRGSGMDFNHRKLQISAMGQILENCTSLLKCSREVLKLQGFMSFTQGTSGGCGEAESQIALTGESLPVTKHPGQEVFSGSTCKQGEIEAVVIATAIGNFCICSIAVGMLTEIIVMYPIQHRKYRDGIDNLLLSQQGAITKRMTAIEEMAGMDVLCSDKTGTLTLNKLTVDKNLVEVIAKGVDKDHVILLAARLPELKTRMPYMLPLLECLLILKRCVLVALMLGKSGVTFHPCFSYASESFLKQVVNV
ncbi:unnamed protein product [Sphenostylis stenocarpa]|uniref:TIR domain-containing protein n=1 Tax=Sphenostylis stenocarpa TaxID=92480 RepID=A0AA86TRA4_9FABA|nr:unnamed protein product [Sphenostylis stenocarpa]